MALTPIARWNYVTYQRITAATKIGVVAFSKAGITKVAFSWNGGAAVNVTSPTYNSVSDTWEYWTDFDPANYADGNVTLDATITGDDAGTRVLSQLTVIANDGGTLASNEAWVTTAGNDSTGAVNNVSLPYLTIGAAATAIATTQSGDASGGTIYLAAGSYVWTGGTIACATERLVIIGVSKTMVTISRGTLSIAKYKLTGVKITHNGVGYGILVGSSNGEDVWLTDIDCEGSDREAAGAYVTWTSNGPEYFTHSTFSTMRGVGYNITMARGLTIQSLGDDAFVNTPCIINCTVDDIDPGTTGWHADAIQFFDGIDDDNIIVYNFRGTNLYYQGMFWRGGVNNDTASKGCAFVNVMLEANAAIVGGIWASYRSIDHWVVHHCTVIMPNGRCSFSEEPEDTGNTDMPEVDFRGCSLPAVLNNIGIRLDTVGWYDNRYGDASGNYITPGSRYTIGDPDLDANGAPNSGSPLESAMVRLTGVPADINGDVRSGVTAIGAYRGKDEAGIIQHILIRTREKAKRI